MNANSVWLRATLALKVINGELAMNKIKKVTIFWLSILLGTLSLNAKAVCTASNIAGTWRVFSVTGAASFQGFGRGTMVFAPTGALNTRASSIGVSNGTVLRFAGGRVQVSRTCQTTGRIVTTAGIAITLVDGRLDTNKTVISGVYRRSDGDMGLVNFIK